jgi:hypothetical protein
LSEHFKNRENAVSARTQQLLRRLGRAARRAWYAAERNAILSVRELIAGLILHDRADPSMPPDRAVAGRDPSETFATAVVPNGVALARHEIHCCRGLQSTHARAR